MASPSNVPSEKPLVQLVAVLLAAHLVASLLLIAVASGALSALSTALLVAALVFALLSGLTARWLLAAGLLVTVAAALDVRPSIDQAARIVEHVGFLAGSAVTGLIAAGTDLARLGLLAAVAAKVGAQRVRATARVAFILRIFGALVPLSGLVFGFVVPIGVLAALAASRKSLRASVAPSRAQVLVATFAAAAVFVLQWSSVGRRSPDALHSDMTSFLQEKSLESLDKVYGELAADPQQVERAARECGKGDLNACAVHGRYLYPKSRDVARKVLWQACLAGNMTACDLNVGWDASDTETYVRQCQLGRLLGCAVAGNDFLKRGKAEEARKFHKLGCYEVRKLASCPDNAESFYGPGEQDDLRRQAKVRTKTKLALDRLAGIADKIKKGTGTWPDDLADLVRATADHKDDPTFDAWGRQVRYRRFETSVNFQSSGPDGAFDTVDDVVYWTPWQEAAQSYLK